MKIISCANQKGGVGKTTTCINLAHYFARRGKRVLVVDMDVQGHAATCLGRAKGNGLFKLLVMEEPIERVVEFARPGMNLITSNKMTEKIKTFMSDMVGRELYIAKCLTVIEGYDLVLIDLAPGSDLLHVGALVASDYMIIPAKLDFLALDGVMEILATVRSLAQLPSVEPPQLIGVLPTMYERTTNETVENLRRLAEAVSEAVVLPPIPADTHVREAAARGLTIWEYAPDTAAAIGYPGHGSVARNAKGNLGGYLHLGEIVEEVVR